MNTELFDTLFYKSVTIPASAFAYETAIVLLHANDGEIIPTVHALQVEMRNHRDFPAFYDGFCDAIEILESAYEPEPAPEVDSSLYRVGWDEENECAYIILAGYDADEIQPAEPAAPACGCDHESNGKDCTPGYRIHRRAAHWYHAMRTDRYACASRSEQNRISRNFKRAMRDLERHLEGVK